MPKRNSQQQQQPFQKLTQNEYYTHLPDEKKNYKDTVHWDIFIIKSADIEKIHVKPLPLSQSFQMSSTADERFNLYLTHTSTSGMIGTSKQETNHLN